MVPLTHRYSLYFMIIGQCLLCILAMGMIFFVSNIPNAWLALYSVALVLVWHIYFILPDYILDMLSLHPQSCRLWSWILAIIAGEFLYVGIVSAYSSYYLVPRSILQDILAFVIYGTALGFDLLLWYLCYRVYHPEANTTPITQYLFEVKKRQENIKTWKDSLSQHNISQQNDNKKDIFVVNFKSYWKHRLIYVSLWIMIPLWIFVIIPLQSFDNINKIPWYYLSYMIITIISLILWLISLLKESTTHYELTAYELSAYCWGKIVKIPWSEICLAELDHENLRIYLTKHQKIIIPILELQQKEVFWTCLQNYLPLGIWMIHYDGWHLLAKFLDMQRLQTFLEKYQTFCQSSKQITPLVEPNLKIGQTKN